MYVVLEEIENEMARLVPDSSDLPIYLAVKKMPRSYAVGDVFNVKVSHDHQLILEKDDREKERRLTSSEAKRRELLRRSAEKEQDS